MKFQKPYTVKKRFVSSFLFEVETYDIVFEEAVLFCDMNYNIANRMAGALNGAYNLGHQNALIENNCLPKGKKGGG